MNKRDFFCSSYAFPIKTKILSVKHSVNPWITSDLAKLVKTKSDYFYLYKSKLISKEENNNFKNKVNNIVKKRKVSYYRDIFHKNRNDIKSTWKHINLLLHKNLSSKTIKKIVVNNISYTEDSEIANAFNEYFCSVGENLNSQIPDSNLDPLSYIVFNSNSSFWLNPVSNDEVCYLINNTKNSKQNFNCISIPILKCNSNFLSKIICKIINFCFSKGTFPKILKHALVLPLFKKGDETKISNFRPISILPTLSKIMEKSIKSRLVQYFTLNNIISSLQFGFQSGISTQDAILHVVENIYSKLNEKLATIGVFIDFSKAFDTINREILLKKLEKYGIRGLALQLLSSYLTNRTQSVKVGSSFSECRSINIGVPQGSVLGPLLFLIYVNDLPLISNLFTSCLFADDTSLLFSHSNFDELTISVNSGLVTFADWCCANRLSINVAKTNFMIFSNVALPDILPDILLNGIAINRTSSVRFLGVDMDVKLKFHHHIRNISTKISKNTGIIRKLSYFIPPDILLKLYYALIDPYLNYCLIIFGGTYDVHISSLEVAQRKAVRVVCNENYSAHSNPLFSKLKILKLNDIYKLHLGTFMYKNKEKFSELIVNRPYDTRNNDQYSPAFQRLDLTQRQSVNFQVPQNWNKIPEQIKNAKSLKSFKKNL